MQEQYNRSTSHTTIEEIFTTVFVIVDDKLREVMPKEVAERKNVKEAKLSDSEVITIGLTFLPFPQVNERSRFNRRRKDLTQVINFLRIRIADIIGKRSDDIHIIDSLPISVCHYKRSSRARVFANQANYGVCEAKEEKIYGFKLRSLITNEGLIIDFNLAAASYHDVVIAEELLAEHNSIIVIGDKGY